MVYENNEMGLIKCEGIVRAIEMVGDVEVHDWIMGGGAGGAVAPPVFAKFLQNLPFLPQILAFLCLQPPHVPVSPRTFKFTPPSMWISLSDRSKDFLVSMFEAYSNMKLKVIYMCFGCGMTGRGVKTVIIFAYRTFLIIVITLLEFPFVVRMV